MPRNGSGGYSPPVNSWYPATSGTNISSTDWNSTLSDLAAALTQSVSKDGQTTMTGNLPMGGYKLTGMAAGTSNGDSVRYEQSPAGIMTTRGDLLVRGASSVSRLALGASGYLLASDGTDVGWSNALSIASITTSGAGTIGGNLSGAGTFTLSGDISPSSISTSQNNYAPTGLSGAAVIRQDCSAAVNITGLTGGADGRILIWQNISSTYAQTFVNESASSTAANRFTGGRNVVVGAGQFCAMIYDATSTRWRFISTPDIATATTSQAGQLATSTDAQAKAKSSTAVALTPSNLAAVSYMSSTGTAFNTVANSSVSENHGLGAMPRDFGAFIECVTIDLGYAVGDRIRLSADNGGGGFSVWANSTAVGMSMQGTHNESKKDGSGVAALTLANWKVYLYASLV